MALFSGRTTIMASVTMLAALGPGISAAAIPTAGTGVTTLGDANIENPFHATKTPFTSSKELAEHDKHDALTEAAVCSLKSLNCHNGFREVARAAEVTVAYPPCLAIIPGKDCAPIMRRRGYKKPEVMVPEVKEGKDQRQEEDEELHQFEKRFRTNPFWPKCPWGS